MEFDDDDVYYNSDDVDRPMSYNDDDCDFMGEETDDSDHNNEDSNGNKDEVYNILKEQDVIKRQQDRIQEVCSVLSVSKPEAILMLHHYNWRVDVLHEAWFDDDQNVRKAVGLVYDDAAGGDFRGVTCGICFEDYSTGDAKSLGCGHFFCIDCWRGYVTTSINDGSGCLSLRCPTPRCGAAVSVDMIQELASVVLLKKFYKFLAESYVEGNKKMKWCRRPGCESVIEYVSGGGSYDVTCQCGYCFCWNCTQEIHRPVGCETVAKWDHKNSNESENANWILAFTKPCPNCKKPIEKNHGCMHMTCKCKHEFCWTCMRDYKTHGMCNGYDGRSEEGKVVNDDERKKQNARNMLEKYMHYYERWIANHNSRDKARGDLEQMKNVHLDRLSLRVCQTDEQLKFLPKAWLQIIECRRVLKWTYTYGFYFPENEPTKRQFFEYLQGEAEASLERLHRCAEEELQQYLVDGDGPVGDFNEYRAKLECLTKSTQTYFENLVRALENGLADVESQGASSKNMDGREGPAKKAKMSEGRKKNRDLSEML